MKRTGPDVGSVTGCSSLERLVVSGGTAYIRNPERKDTSLDLTPYRDTSRLFLIFAPSRTDERYHHQRQLLQGAEEGLADRDLVLAQLLEDGEGFMGGNPVSPEEAAGARQNFAVGDGEFAAVLIGKDGTEKLRSGEPVSAEELFERIDEMPLRQQEMEEG